MLGLPGSIRACLFDLDGVLTRTATVHMAAWKRTFDEFLRRSDPAAREFTQEDYNRFVDGKPRLDGVRDFLASRGITLPEGTPDDPPDALTVHGVAARKNDLLGLMLQGRDPVTGEGLSDENIRYQMVTFLIAGHETTSGLLSFALYLLLKNPQVLNQARAEVDAVLGEDTPRVEQMARLGPHRLRYVDLGLFAGFSAGLSVDDEGWVDSYEGLFERVAPSPGA